MMPVEEYSQMPMTLDPLFPDCGHDPCRMQILNFGDGQEPFTIEMECLTCGKTKVSEPTPEQMKALAKEIDEIFSNPCSEKEMGEQISGYRNVQSGELAPSHRIGTAEDGRPLYQAQTGWEPVEAYESDSDGNWLP